MELQLTFLGTMITPVRPVDFQDVVVKRCVHLVHVLLMVHLVLVHVHAAVQTQELLLHGVNLLLSGRTALHLIFIQTFI